jgi:predicted amidohydrolase
MSEGALRLAGAQIEVQPGNIQTNLKRSIEMIEECARHGVDLVCFPECTLDGYAFNFPNLYDLARNIPCQETEQIAGLARKNGIWIMYTLAEKWEGKVANTALLFDRQGVLRLHYRKTHLCSEEGETIAYKPGTELPVATLDHGFLTGAMICYDRHFPEVSRTLHLKGANLILHPTATNWFTPNPEHINHAMMRTRAYENRSYVFSVNQVNFGGGSALYGPWGEVLALAGKEEEILYAEIDLRRIHDMPDSRYDLLATRRPDLYEGCSK